MASAERRYRVQLKRRGDWPQAIKAVDGGGHLLVPFTATLTDEDEIVTIELVIDVIDGHPNCTSFAVTATDDEGLLLRAGQILQGVKIRDAVALALTYAVLVEEGDGTFVDAVPGLWEQPDGTFVESPWPTGGQTISMELIDKVRGRVKRRREPMTTESLEKFADEYRNARAKAANDHTPWDAEAFAASIGYSLRQFYNRKKAAKERKILKEGE